VALRADDCRPLTPRTHLVPAAHIRSPGNWLACFTQAARLQFVELALPDVEVADVLMLGLAGRDRTADETRRFFEQALERRLGHPPQPPPAAANAHVRYQVMSSVPAH
jgi:hypothetical protein